MQNGSGTLLGDFEWQGSKHGGLGWVMGVDGSANNTHMLAWADVCQVYKKAVEDVDWQPLIVPGKVPADLIGTYVTGTPAYIDNGTPGAVRGGYDAAFGGSGSNRIYVAIQNRVITTTNGENFTNTAITGMALEANSSTRMYGPKGAADHNTDLAYYIFMGAAGLRYTLDGGATMVNPAWCPAPSQPSATTAKYGLVAIDRASALVSGRSSRIAFAPCGQGIWLSTDGGATGANITGSSGIEAAVSLAWVGSNLYAAVTSASAPSPLQTANLRKWDGTNWTTVALPGTYAVQCIVPDPRYPGVGFWAFLASGDFLHTQNGTTFASFVGGTAPDGRTARGHGHCNTKPRSRPLVANKYRYEATQYAISMPVVIGPYLVAPVGLGVLRTPVANFPLAGADWNDVPFSADWPVWEEDIGGFEEIVGMSALWGHDGRLWCLGQDIGIALWETGDRGHRATVHKFPSGGILTDVHGASRGSTPGYMVARRTRSMQNNVAGFCYSSDGYTWQNMVNQPTQGPAAVYESGHGVAGPLGQALCFPTRAPARPQYTADLGATAWQPLQFWIGSTQLDLAAAETSGYTGFHGGDFSKNHHVVCHDNDNPGNYYCVNIGATMNEGTTSWVYDPLGWAGIYHMAPGEFGVFRRIYTGHPAWFSNFGYYDCKLLVNAGKLVFISNYLPGDPHNQANQPAIIDIASATRTLIDGVRNCQSISFGAPFPGDTNRCLWLLGWTKAPAQQFGLFYSRDNGATVVGPFNSLPIGGGFLKYIEAHPTTWGVIAGSVESRGHALGRYRMVAQ